MASELEGKNARNMAHEASIIIPNFDNGRGSSLDGETDLLGDLLESIRSTLEDDPTPVEILIADDGSSDDSLETARAWSRIEWRDGRPFCRLIEMKHSGVLSRVLNVLMRETAGRIVCRFDGDVRLLSKGWLSRAVACFDHDQELGVLGGRQLAHDGSLHSMGDLLFHPHGYQHIGAGATTDFQSLPFEHDHVMGCFQILRRAAFEAAGEYDEDLLRGQTVDLGVRLRSCGWKAMTDPGLIYEHRHGLRRGREARGDDADAITKARLTFAEKWGFDRLCPDMDVMRARLGEAILPPVGKRLELDTAGIGDDPGQIENRVGLVRGSITPGKSSRVLVIGGGDGEVGTALARKGVNASLIDDRREAVREAMRLHARDQDHVVPHLVPDLSSLPVHSGLIDLLLVDRVLERHPNPIRFLTETRRMLSDDGVLLLLARWRTPEEQIMDPRSSDRFTPSSLRGFLTNSGLFSSIDFTQRPFSNPEPGVLIYALTPMHEDRDEPRGNAIVADPSMCT